MNDKLKEIYNIINNSIYGEDFLHNIENDLYNKKLIVIYGIGKEEMIMKGCAEGVLKINDGLDFSKFKIDNRESKMLKISKEIKLKALWYGEIKDKLINEEFIEQMWSFEVDKKFPNMNFSLLENDEEHVIGILVDVSKLNI